MVYIKVLMISVLLLLGIPALADHDHSHKNRASIITHKTVMVSEQSPVFTLKMPSNPSTGYSWFLVKYDHQLLTPLGRHYFPPKESKPGASGEEEWQFRVKSRTFSVPRVTHIILKYVRPWIGTQPAEKRVFTVVIQSASPVE